MVPECLMESTFSAQAAKKFCVGLLENPEVHPWWASVRGLSASDRLSIAGSLFLFRKCLPSEGKPDELRSQHRERLCTSPSQVTLPAGYLSHCRRIARECFPPGWDSQYQDLAWGSCPSVKSCRESTRSKGGPRALGIDRASYLRNCLRETAEVELSTDVDFLVVTENGKDRMVTRSSASTGVLRPLHKALYNRLSRLPWLLRGEAKASKFRDFGPVQGEVFVSGDYEAATDFLPIEVASAVMEEALRNSRWIPSSLGRAALRSLRANIHYDDSSLPFEQQVGQLMGNLLSFPLLCVQNYCAFRWIFPASVPVRINGDDIVFRCSPAKYREWASFVATVGLRLSAGKTMVHSRFFSVNSTFFRSARSHPPSVVPVLRTGGLAKPVECYSGFSGALRRFTLGFTGASRTAAEVMFLRHRARSLRASGRSLIRGLGMPVSVEGLQKAGLWRRECWYAELPVENPLPADPSRLLWAGVPEGWRRVASPAKQSRSWKRRSKELQSAFIRELVSLAWSGSPTLGKQQEAYMLEVASTGFETRFREWVQSRSTWSRRPLFKGWVNSQPRTLGAGRVRRWVADGVPSLSRRQGVGFVSCTKMVWEPKEEEPEEIAWNDCTPWETRFGGETYEQFILGDSTSAVLSHPE